MSLRVFLALAAACMFGTIACNGEVETLSASPSSSSTGGGGVGGDGGQGGALPCSEFITKDECCEGSKDGGKCRWLPELGACRHDYLGDCLVAKFPCEPGFECVSYSADIKVGGCELCLMCVYGNVGVCEPE